MIVKFSSLFLISIVFFYPKNENSSSVVVIGALPRDRLGFDAGVDGGIAKMGVWTASEGGGTTISPG